MDNKGNIDLLTAFKKLLAESNSQEARLEECFQIVASRDKEIEMLQTMLSEADEYRSSTDNQLQELQGLQRYLNDLPIQTGRPVFTGSGRQQQVGIAVSIEQQLKNLRLEYTYLQLQLADLQTQLQEVNNRNLLLQQQNSRIAELESLLENTAGEVSKWKGQANPPE